MTNRLLADMLEADGFASKYDVADNSYDELCMPNGQVRPHWRQFIEGLSALTSSERQSRSRRLERQVRETGLAHDIFSDPDQAVQPWQIDLIPLIISAAEWRWLSKALQQRAQLMTMILADLYGPQNLLRSGSIPAALVFADPTFLRNCVGIAPPAGHLQFYSADLARGPDGLWRVIDNHAETPAGVGYVIANRLMHAEVAGDLLGTCNATRLAAHFRAVQDALRKRLGSDEANIAVLTPGPDHGDFFSHAYLARYLGLPLVQGGDLRVVGSDVFLKSLEGLKKVDMLLRCVEGANADPLELNPNGFDGPAGLVHACRAQPALVSNALGSAVIENRGLGAYLPKLAQELLGEELMLHDAPRHWLGDARSDMELDARLANCVVRPIREGMGRPGQAGLGQVYNALDAAGRAALRKDIATHGDRLVAEQRVGFSTMPEFTQNGLHPHAFAARMFVAATAEGFRALPGGVTIAVDPNNAVALSAPNADTHDIWVISDAVEATKPGMRQPELLHAEVHRSNRVLQSRMADNLYWLGRNLERADWTMRVMRSALGRRFEFVNTASVSHHAGDACLLRLLRHGSDPNVAEMPGPTSRLVAALATQKIGDYSLERSFDGIQRIANVARDRLSLEAARTLTTFHVGERWRQRMSEAGTSELQDEIELRLEKVAAFNGQMHENMTRNYGWFFIDIGRRLERAYNLCITLESMLLSTQPGKERDRDTTDNLKFVLEVADSFITYRSRYSTEPSLPLVLDLLLLDEANPRSLAYQVAQISDHLEALPQSGDGNTRPEERRMILALQTRLRLSGVADFLGDAGEDGAPPKFHALLVETAEMLPKLSDAIARRYFRLVEDEVHRVARRLEVRG